MYSYIYSKTITYNCLPKILLKPVAKKVVKKKSSECFSKMWSKKTTGCPPVPDSRQTHREERQEPSAWPLIRRFAERNSLSLRKTSQISMGRAVISPAVIQLCFRDICSFLTGRPNQTTILVYELCHYLSFWVVTIWVLKFCHPWFWLQRQRWKDMNPCVQYCLWSKVSNPHLFTI